MKRLFSLLLCVLFFSGCAAELPPDGAQDHAPEIRAVWISYQELTMPKGDYTEETFRTIARKMIKNVRSRKLNTVFFHVRPFSDAFYRSAIFPFSAYLTGTEGKDPGYDPLEIFCACAAKEGISVHAWINPFRVGKRAKKCAENPAMSFLNDESSRRFVSETDGSLYYDPACPEVHELILRGVRELLEKYSIDGIHIDDYFYPSTDASIDEYEYQSYVEKGGTLPLEDWRRSTVSSFIQSMYRCVKSFGADKVFSISPAANIERNYDTLYADVARWSSYDGYCDWMIPQLYVGFDNETLPFRTAADTWQSLVKAPHVRLLAGLAAYKCGQTDMYAGNGRDEWLHYSDILSRQLAYSRALSSYGGFALFSYSALFEQNANHIANTEISSLMDMV